MDDEDRIALFLDYENLALGARDHLGGAFDLKPVSDALAERGRVVVRRAYADWSYFDEDRRMLTRSHVELIEMPQRMGASRKNAADIKMAVDAIELAFVRDYVSTFVICTGDSDFTPLVHKLRELNKRVIGVGVRDSTSKMLPPSCDEFLFYDNLEGVEPAPESGPQKGGGRSRRGRGEAAKSAAKGEKAGAASAKEPTEPAEAVEPAEVESEDTPRDQTDVAVLVAQTVAGVQQSSGGAVTASVLKRTLMRKDPTFSETDHGFRAFGDLLEHLSERGVIELATGPAKGDPEILLPEVGDGTDAFTLLRGVVAERSDAGETVGLSGLKNQLRRSQPGFSEKKLGYRSFLQFCKAADAAGIVSLEWSEDEDDYLLTVPAG
ncbi:MAG: NYN domain-containing protein [Ornithinimicrobium sp.]|uniref:NYN domain-containing protein n=1 Tax=Ornithinimicrobium sp. TaxID=1977084 RepID=UPI003D9BBD99